MNLQRFVPNFIKQLDHYLLIHFPTIWQSRIHNVLYATITTNLVLAGLALILPVNIGHRYDLWEWTWTFFVVSITYLVIWMIHVGRFNIFKQYGKLPIGDEYLNFFLHILCVLMIASTMFSFHYVYDQKIRNIVSNTELARDINTLNLGAPFFPAEWNHFRLYNEDGIDQKGNSLYLYNYHNFDRFGNQRFWNSIENPDNQNYYNRYDGYESAEKQLIDSTLKEPDPCTQSKYGLNCFEKNKTLFNQQKSEKGQLLLINNFIITAKKYGINITEDANDILKRFDRSENFKFKLDNTNDYWFSNELRKLDTSIGYVISSKTDRIIFYDPNFWRVMWYLSFYTTLLFMIYRNVRRRDFILSVVSGIVIMIVSGIIIALTRLNSEKEIFGFYFMIYCALAIGAIVIFARKSHSWVNASCLNLVMVATPILPVLYYSLNGSYNHKDFYYWEMAGFILFFLLLQILFKKLYSTLWALPER